jgi:hypothetical protein
MTQIIHVKPDHEGQIRITLAEPHGLVQAHRRVIARVPGLKYDKETTRVVTLPSGRTEERTSQAGEDVEGIEILLAGQTQFLVPQGTSALEFDDGTITLTPPQEAKK